MNATGGSFLTHPILLASLAERRGVVGRPCPYIRSIIVAMPMPPPMHMVTSPVVLS